MKYKTLDQCLGYDKLRAGLPKTEPRVIKLLGTQSSKNADSITTMATLKAMERGAVVRPFRKIGKRKPRQSRIEDSHIITMNRLYEKGVRVENIAYRFDISQTYCNNLISRFRYDNSLVELSKTDRGTVASNTMNRSNKDKEHRTITRHATLIRRAINNGQP